MPEDIGENEMDLDMASPKVYEPVSFHLCLYVHEHYSS